MECRIDIIQSGDISLKPKEFFEERHNIIPAQSGVFVLDYMNFIQAGPKNILNFQCIWVLPSVKEYWQVKGLNRARKKHEMNNKNIISKFVDTAKAVFKKKFIKLNISITKKKGLKSI